MLTLGFFMCFLTLFKCITTQPRYANMSKALNESGQHIALNMCRGDLHPWSYIDAYAQSWRVTEDHTGKWSMPAHGIKQGIATALHIPREATGKPYVRAPLPCVNSDVVATIDLGCSHLLLLYECNTCCRRVQHVRFASCITPNLL